MQAESVYQTLFWIGTLGVVAMGAMGAMHGSHGGHGHGHGHSHSHGADGVHGGHGPFGHNAPHGNHSGAHTANAHHADTYGHGHGNHHDATHHEGAGSTAGAMITILGYLSPMTLFSVSLGAGATGILLGKQLSIAITAVLAILIGLMFFAWVIRPAMGFIQSFASKPATNLAGTIATEATAQNRFDAQGRGIVQVPLDGEIVRLLAYLEPEDHAKGVLVAPGDKLTVTRIHEGTNTCHVTKL